MALIVLAPTVNAQPIFVDFSFWTQNGDSIVFPSGITVAVTGDSNTLKSGNNLQNIKETASQFVFDFDRALSSLDIEFLSLDGTFDRVHTFSHPPTTVAGSNLIFTGSAITASGSGVNPWDGIAGFTGIDDTQLSFILESDAGSNSGLFISRFGNAVAVPEPNAVYLVAAMLIGVCWLSRTRRTER